MLEAEPANFLKPKSGSSETPNSQVRSLWAPGTSLARSARINPSDRSKTFQRHRRRAELGLRPSEMAVRAVNLSIFTISLGADVAMNVTANYSDGPSIAQGSTGTWWVSGTVTVFDSVQANFFCTLWDGTTVISSGAALLGANVPGTISLSGFLATPVGNLKISCRDATNTTGLIKFNTCGNSKDSTISASRIQ